MAIKFLDEDKGSKVRFLSPDPPKANPVRRAASMDDLLSRQKFGTGLGVGEAIMSTMADDRRRRLKSNLEKFEEGVTSELISPAMHGLNNASFGLLREFVRKVSPEEEATIFQDQETLPGKAARFGAEVYGLVKGAPGKITAGIGKQMVPAGSKVLQRIVGGATQGAVAGALTPTEQLADLETRLQNITGGVVVGGALGILPGTGKVVKGVSSKEDLAGRIVNSLIKPMKRDFSYGKNPGLAIAQEKIVGKSFDELGIRTARALSKRTSELKRMTEGLTQKGVKVNVGKFVQPIDDEIVRASGAPNTNKALIERLQGVKQDLIKPFFLSPKQTTLTVKEAVNLKRKIGDITKFTGNMSDDGVVNKALKMSYGRVKGAIEKVAPQTKKLNGRIADLISAQSAIKNREMIASRHNMLGLKDSIFGGGGAVVGGLAGGPRAAGLTGLGMTALNKILATPGAKTRTAKLLAEMGKKEREKLIKGGTLLMDKVRTGGSLAGGQLGNFLDSF